MDNDSSIKKNLVLLYRKARLRIDYIGMNFLNEEKGNEQIATWVTTSEPFMVGRLGGTEMRCVIRWIQGKPYSEQTAYRAWVQAGVFPNDSKGLDRFCKVYTDAIQSCDLIGVCEVPWEKRAIQMFGNKPQLTPARAIEPYYYEEPWSANLQGKKVLIIHPFVDSICRQIAQRERIWPGKNVLPEFGEISMIRAVQSIAGSKPDFEDWTSALEWMKKEMEQIDFDVAIIGAGAYALPLAAHAKNLGKQAIQTSGATQILFGIKGKRWDQHPVISKFYNDAWIRPSAEETPQATEKVEGGSYW